MKIPQTVSKVVQGENVFYNVPWTALRLADRHDIARQAPSIAGIVQLFWEDDVKKLHLFTLDAAWYGGIRAKVAEAIDVDWEHDKERKRILEDRVVYYRYVVTESHADLTDLMNILVQIHYPKRPCPPHSGRFKWVHIRENPLVF